MATRLFAALSLLGFAGAAPAHHAFAPHFDASKPVSITGTVIEYELRNPHAYLRVSAPDENGLIREYRCESHGVTQLSRNGIRPEMLTPGTVVSLTGSQSRTNPYECFFDSVGFEDGRVLSVNGPRGAASREPETVRHDIYGTWMRATASSTPSGNQPMMEFMTPAGEAAVAAYDPLTDDPVLRCDPVAIRRVWFAPGTPLSISRNGDEILLKFEWMDAERIVHLNQTAHPAGGPRTSLGHSIGHFEGDTLVIETASYSAGVLSQYVQTPGKPLRGMLHSDALTSVERVRFNPETNRLELSIELDDPVYFTRKFDPATATYAPSDLKIEPFDCRPENPDHTLIED
jgi:Family of unknown function (DUF6152)